MSFCNFVHLHTHSHYSLLDGAASVKGIVDAAAAFGMPAVCITDHGNMFSCIELYQTALKKGLKPIFGFEAYITPSKITVRDPKMPLFHLVLLAQNMTGYKNLLKLASIGYTEGFYRKPRIDYECLEQYSEGLIGLGACLKGEIPQALLNDDKAKAVEILKRYQKIFGIENFYVEIQNHGIPDQIKILEPLVELARENNAPIVATNDSHYLMPDDWETQDALLALGTNTTLDDPKRFKFQSHEFYYKSPEEMNALFAKWPDSIENTVKIADRCNVQIQMGKSILPEFKVPEGMTASSYLRQLCVEGIKRRYGENPSNDVLERYEFEMGTIEKMGYPAYFLIVYDFINEARKMGIPVGPGRGSAAGSIVSYLLGITDICPIKYDLLFERFLNPDRISMPDIDVDFSDEGRPKVIEYVQKKYGKKRVSQIITFNFMLAKMAIRDMGRVLGMPLDRINEIAKLVPEKPGTHLKSCLTEIPELKEIYENGTPEEKKLLKLASNVDGMARHTGVHACGIIISAMDLDEVSPLYVDPKAKIGELNLVVSQYEKHAVEDIGLLKMDFLGLKTLTVLQNAVKNVKITRNLEVDLEHLDFEDTKVYQLLQKGLTLGVFQLESTGMRGLLKKLLPDRFTDIIALLAMYRPGPLKSGMVDDYVQRKHGLQEVKYPHPSLEPVLKDTYGVYLYQEQVMLTSRVLAGFTKGQADALRKAMGKKIKEKMVEMGEKFVKGAIERGVDAELAQDIFDLMAGFAEYGFNKSHSAAYAVVTYRTAYMKAYYPKEFMAACLTSESGNTDKLAEYVNECRALGFEVLPPDINKSLGDFSVEGDTVRYGLSAIKGIGSEPVDNIVKAREKLGPFKDICDFIQRIDTRVVNNRVLSALVLSGAFDCFKLNKAQMMVMVEDALKKVQSSNKHKNPGQSTFFEAMGEEASGFGNIVVDIPEIPEFSERELMFKEREVLGYFLTSDLLRPIEIVERTFCNIKISTLAEYTQRNNDAKKENDSQGDNADSNNANQDFSDRELEAYNNKYFKVCGTVIEVKKIITKKEQKMAIVTIEAHNSRISMAVFPEQYKDYSYKLMVDEPIFAIIKTQVKDGAVNINADAIYNLVDFDNADLTKMALFIPKKLCDKNNYIRLKTCLENSPGNIPATIRLITPDDKKVTISTSSELNVALTPQLISDWTRICGQDSIRLSFPIIEEIYREKVEISNKYKYYAKRKANTSRKKQ